MTDIISKLDYLSDLRCQLDAIRLHYDDLRKSAIPAEILSRLDEIAAEETTALETAHAAIVALEGEIRAAVLKAGATVKGAHLMAVWNKGRTSWDTRGLDGFMVAHPEIGAFRKEGAPTVSFRDA